MGEGHHQEEGEVEARHQGREEEVEELGPHQEVVGEVEGVALHLVEGEQEEEPGHQAQEEEGEGQGVQQNLPGEGVQGVAQVLVEELEQEGVQEL